MPKKLKRPCSYPGCPKLTDGRYCAEHQKQVTSAYDKGRGGGSRRGYGANHQRLRKIVMAEEPLCRHCLEKGIFEPSTEMDHIDGNQWSLGRSNLQMLCKPCHSRKTIREQGGFGNK